MHCTSCIPPVVPGPLNVPQGKLTRIGDPAGWPGLTDNHPTLTFTYRNFSPQQSLRLINMTDFTLK